MGDKETCEHRRKRLPRRAWLHVSGLVAVMVLCFAFAAWATRSQPAEASVLAVAGPLAAGQLIGESDLAEVVVAAGEVDTLGLITTGQAGAVLGKVAAMPLAAGTLLHEGMIGAPIVPQIGYEKVTVALADGRWPTDVQIGQQIALIGASDAAATGVWQTAGLVLAVERPEEGGALVTVELPEGASAGLVTVEPASMLMAATAAPPVVEPSTGGGG
jgi:hypothetical protein